MRLNKLKSIFFTIMMASGFQINAEFVNWPKISEHTQGDYVLMRVEEGSEAIVGGNFNQYVIDIERMGFKKVFSVSLDNIEGHWGAKEDLFVSRVNKNNFVLKAIKNQNNGYLRPAVKMLNTSVKITVVKYTVLGL